MQGIVTDEKGAYVKAVIVNLIRAKDSEDGSGAVDVTYAETDEEGKFVIQDLDPDERYIIEIRVEYPAADIETKAAEILEEPVVDTAVAEPQEEPEQKTEVAAEPPVQPSFYDADNSVLDDEAEAPDSDEAAVFAEDSVIIDSLERNNMIEYTIRENISIDNLYSAPGYIPKDKPYLIKSNLW